jgi:CheY-like chemotaxis protein
MARILVVEDNPQNLVLSTVILNSGGHEVIPAQDASAAEQLLARETPDLILMDLALPGKDGYTLTRELRQRPETARVPILAVTSFAMPGDAEKALAAGCTAYLTKPIRRAVLLERVTALLGSMRPPAATPPPNPSVPSESRPPHAPVPTPPPTPTEAAPLETGPDPSPPSTEGAA